MVEASETTVLVVGATGFLGPALVEELSLAGFSVVCGVRNLKKAGRELNFPRVKFLKVDLNQDLKSEVWRPRIEEYSIDIVINNVGIANCFGCQSLENVNVLAPLALFDAFEDYLKISRNSAGKSLPVRVIQISTTGVDWPDCNNFSYPASKRLLEEQLVRFGDLPFIIVRPNVIYEPKRGHLLLERIARIPIVFYVGHALIQPIHCREIAIGISRLLLRQTIPDHTILRACGPARMSWREIFITSSSALGKNSLCYCRVPLKLAQLVTMVIQKLPKKILNRFGILSKMDPDTILMMTKGSVGSNKEWLRATGLRPVRLDETYREYGKGPRAYSAFIESIRNST